MIAIRFLAWAVAVVVFGGFVTLARVHTRLGVEAPVGDKHGREYIWRVWWRARHDIVDVGSDAVVTAIYVCLALGFVALSVLAFWLALVPDDHVGSGQARPDPSHPQ